MSSTFLQALEQRGERVSAVVLAGGLARRMEGQDKGLVEVGGKPMSAWVLSTIASEVHDVFINANRNQEQYAALLSSICTNSVNGDSVAEQRVIADLKSGHLGPLAGLSAALHHSENQYMFMCPCDSPFLDPAMVSLLGTACLEKDADIAVAHDGERMQPVFCMVNRRCLDSLDAYLDLGERKIDRWYGTLNTVEVDCSALNDSFRNINTEQERQAALRELGTERNG